MAEPRRELALGAPVKATDEHAGRVNLTAEACAAHLPLVGASSHPHFLEDNVV